MTPTQLSELQNKIYVQVVCVRIGHCHSGHAAFLGIAYFSCASSLSLVILLNDQAICNCSYTRVISLFTGDLLNREHSVRD